MTTIVLSVVVMLLVVVGMAVGVIFSNKPIKGTCGGLNQLDLGECEICGGDPKKCDSEIEAGEAESTTETYDVMARAKKNKLDA